MFELEDICTNLHLRVLKWEKILTELPSDLIQDKKNTQGRSVRQIVGHMVDSASNNTHRIVHLQYQKSPFEFPNYATFGNNDRWISIQNYQEENWENLVHLWKYLHLHIIHIIKNIDQEKLDNLWIAGEGKEISLKEMVVDFPRHFKLHISEIEELINVNGSD